MYLKTPETLAGLKTLSKFEVKNRPSDVTVGHVQLVLPVHSFATLALSQAGRTASKQSADVIRFVSDARRDWSCQDSVRSSVVNVRR